MASNKPSRRPARTDFDYTSTDNRSAIKMMRGLGISSDDEAKVWEHIDGLILQYHPQYDQDTRTWNKGKVIGESRQKLLEKLWDLTPAFCEAPEAFRNMALSTILTHSVSSRLKRSAKKYKKIREEDERSDTNDSSIDGRPSKRARTASGKTVRNDSEGRDTDNSSADRPHSRHIDHTAGHDSHGRTFSLSARTCVAPNAGQPTPGPQTSQPPMYLCTVDNGKILDKISKLYLSCISGPTQSEVSWSKLIAVAEQARMDGFRSFTGRLYLSPRQDQYIPIRTQAELSSAMLDMQMQQVKQPYLFTMLPVKAEVKQEEPLDKKPSR